MTKREFLDTVFALAPNEANKIMDAFDEYVESNEPHWIPVTERLPEENYLDDGYVEPSQPVLVYMSYHTCKISRYWGNRKSKGTSDYVIPDWMDLQEFEEKAIHKVIDALPPAEPKTGRWILDRSGAYCCSECMEPCATYVMMKPRDKFCKMCGSRNEVTE